MMKPAIIAIGYNRADSLERLLMSLDSAIYEFDDIPLIISLDLAANHLEVESVANTFNWKHGKKIVRTFSERQGLRKHVISCGDYSEEYGAVILLEDDLQVAPTFYKFVYEALNYYESDKRIAGAALYSHEWNGYRNLPFTPEVSDYDSYIGQFSISWGQSWTADCWRKFKNWYAQNEGKLTFKDEKMPSEITRWPETSWGKYFAHFMIDEDLYYCIPYHSQSTNNSEPGQHNKIVQTQFQVSLDSEHLSFSFPDYEHAVKYDMYLERIGLEEYFEEGIQKDGVCVDLYGGRAHGSNRYLLSSCLLDYRVVESFGLQLRPHEQNIKKHVAGEVFFLYDTSKEEKNLVNKNDNQFQRLDYYYYSSGWRQALKYALLGIRHGFEKHLRKKK